MITKVLGLFAILLVLVFILLPGCKIEVTVPEGGRVVTQSGAFSCESGKTCVIDVVDVFFDETFEAKPASGYTFTKWRKRDRGLCGGRKDPCHLYTTTFPGTPLEQFLESDEVFYLEPEFEVYGTRLLTEMVKDITPGTKSRRGPWNLIDFKDALYFTGLEDGMAALWRSDGTDEGTVVFKEFAGGDPYAFVVAGDKLFFSGNDRSHGTELWVSDGTPEGTVMTKDIWPGGSTGLLGWPNPLFKDGVLFFADDGMSGPQLWTSDGTEAGTRRFEDAAISYESKARNFWVFGDGWLFKSTDSAHGAELWRTDGTEGGSELVKDIVPGPAGSFASDSFSFAEINGSGVFWVWNENSVELWRTDGTEAGTRMFWVLPDPDLEPYYKLIPYKNMVLFFLHNSYRDYSLWRTDGTQSGTELLREGFIDQPSDFIEYNGFLYLSLMTEDRVSGQELWRTDGTKAGTQIAFDLNPGPASSSPGDFTLYAGLLYFTATDGMLGKELYRTDGSAEGTELVADIAAGPDSSEPDQLTVSQGAIFFDAWEPTSGQELYRTIVLP